MGWPKGKPRGSNPKNAERMRKLNADPEFAAKNAERMRKLNADPEFAAKNAEARRAALARKACVYCGHRGYGLEPDGDDLFACRDVARCEARLQEAATA